MNPFNGLIRSRKFWLMILDTVISLAVFFVGHYLSPEDALPYLTVIGALQPVFVMVIHGITAEDVALKGNIYWGGAEAVSGIADKYGIEIKSLDEPEGKG